MTTVYFIRHAEADRKERDGRIRPLTEAGMKAALSLPERFEKIGIDRVYSSPFKRAVDTVAPIAKAKGLEVVTVEAFKERRSDSQFAIGREEMIRKQWLDFSYTGSDGECFSEVQARNLSALRETVAQNPGKTVIIGTHGVALSTILRAYRPMELTELERLLKIHPYIVKMSFAGATAVKIEEMPLPFIN